VTSAGSVQLLTVVYMPSDDARASFSRQLESQPETVYIDSLGTRYGPTRCRLIEPPPPPPPHAAGGPSPAWFDSWHALEMQLLVGSCSAALCTLLCGAMTCRVLRQRTLAAQLSSLAALTAPACTAPPLDSLRSRWSARSPLFTGDELAAHDRAHAHAPLTPHGGAASHPLHRMDPQPAISAWHSNAARVGVVLNDLPSLLYVDAAGTAHVLLEEQMECGDEKSLQGGHLAVQEHLAHSSSSRGAPARAAGAQTCHGAEMALVVVE
jgi:hypothetical protein